MKTFALNLLAIACAAALVGCGIQEDNVKSELKQLTANLKPHIPPLPAASEYKAFDYEAGALTDPFLPSKVAEQIRAVTANGPDLKRPREALEAFALDNIRMVGAVSLRGSLQAVVNADGYLYHVKTGQYIGQNYGRVTAVTETQVTIKELVQEASGNWVERQTSLSLQDSTR